MEKRKTMILIGLCLCVVLCFGIMMSKGHQKLNLTIKDHNDLSVTYTSVKHYNYQKFNYSSPFDSKTGLWRHVKASEAVKLPDDLKTIVIKKKDITPTKEDLEASIRMIIASYDTASIEKKVTNRKAQNGDTVYLDYAGSVDGVAFTGGTATDQSLTLGSHSFIDNFEEQIVGHMPGDVFDVKVTFPEGYANSTDGKGNTVVLANKKAVFRCKLKAVMDYALTDQWVDDYLSNDYDVETVKELYDYVEKLNYTSNFREKLNEILMKQAVIRKMPQEIFDYETTRLLAIYNSYAEKNDQSLEEYLKSYGYDDAVTMMNQNVKTITTSCAHQLFIQALAERFQVTGEKIADPYGFIDLENAYGTGYARHDALITQVYERCEKEITLK